MACFRIPSYSEFIKWTCCFLLLFLVIPLKISNNSEEQFENYLSSFNKSYDDPEIYTLRLKAFEKSLEYIELFNSNRTSGSAQYGLTKFSDLSPEEFKSTHLKHLSNHSIIHLNKNLSMLKRSLPTYLPKKIDWRRKNVVSIVKNQKNCGACWAFAIIETMESMYAIKTNSSIDLSVQEMIDCSTSNDGCGGGDICSLLQWLKMRNITVVSEDSYPLILENQKCKIMHNSKGVELNDFMCESLIGAEDILLMLLAQHGPIAVAINGQTWQNYVGGIIQFHCNGQPNNLNHAVQIIGYDLTHEIPYYIVRNSWGEDFGDNGYLYIAIGNNMCGLAYEVAALSVV